MRPDFPVHESLGDLMASLWAAMPVNGWLILSILGAVVFCVAWLWGKWERVNAD